jgi:hypothetical protein
MELAIRSRAENATVAEPAGDGTVEVCDRVWVEHANPGDLWLDRWGADQPVEVVATGKLYHSAVPAAQTTSPDPAVPAEAGWELTFTAAGEANAQTVCHAVKAGGYGAYGFAWRIDRADQPAATRGYLAGDAASPLWLPAETTIVTRTPVIHTAAVKWAATTGGAETVYLADEIWQTGWPDGPGESDTHGAAGHGDWAGYGPWEADGAAITVELWRVEGQITPDSCGPDNPEAKLVASNTATPAVNTWGASQKVSGSRFKAEGGDATYTFVVSWPGDARTEPYKSVCGEASETIRIEHDQPKFATELVAETDAGRVAPDTIAHRQAAIQAEPGAALVDVLAVWFDGDGPQASLDGWQATWEVYWQPFADGAGTEALTVIQDPSGTPVYADAVCAPGNLLADTADQPVPIEGPGAVVSPGLSMPDQPGLLHAVETVTDTTGQAVHRGVCGAVSETAVNPPPEPAPPVPKITTTAPERAQTGDLIRDKATLTGPYPAGTAVVFWYQHTPLENPDEAGAGPRCAVPDPDDMDGAVLIGQTVLTQAVPAGQTQVVHSPEFTSEEPGCTWIKEIAAEPGGGGQTLAEGHFGAVNERTVWEQPPPPDLPRTGANTRLWAGAAAAAVAAGAALVAVARARGRQRKSP